MHYHFVTGRLAEPALREVVLPLAAEQGFDYSIGVMPITVAALITPRWLLRHIQVPTEATAVILPGYLEEGRDEIEKELGVTVIIGPRDLRQLPDHFGRREPTSSVMDQYDIRIIAEINHAPRLTWDDTLRLAEQLRGDGADVIDLGCDPANRWHAAGEVTRKLVDLGFTVSIDTFDPWEAENACRHGATLVLSVNGSNREAACDWGCEVVVIPDTPGDENSFFETIAFLTDRGVPIRLDPILEPIGLAFTESLLRYARTREVFPHAEMMMGIGNLTELTDVDSAGLNLLLLAVCQELGIRSVLTTQVINWARSSVRECDLARRMVHYSVSHRTPPKRLDDSLVMLRDVRVREHSSAFLETLPQTLKDNNYRLFVQGGLIHLISSGLHLSGSDPFSIFDQLLRHAASENVDASHAFYLGFEMSKALTAATLGKQYEQDRELQWGHLTRPEKHHRIERRRKRK